MNEDKMQGQPMPDSSTGDSSDSPKQPTQAKVDRREFLSGSTIAMGCGLVASYGTLAGYAGFYLYPSEARQTVWLFVAELGRLRAGESLRFTDPTGAKIVVARQREAGTADDFIALSSVCPHLGCQVHWQSQENRFFCPCHNGVFSPEGKATEGPPAAAGQSLAHYPLKVEKGMLFIEVPVERLV